MCVFFPFQEHGFKLYAVLLYTGCSSTFIFFNSFVGSKCFCFFSLSCSLFFNFVCVFFCSLQLVRFTVKTYSVHNSIQMIFTNCLNKKNRFQCTFDETKGFYSTYEKTNDILHNHSECYWINYLN